MNKLNVNYSQSVGKFEAAMKKKLLIKSIFYKRVFGGKGFEFDSFRRYESGVDDANLIDWKASLKAHTSLVRKYIEERDLNIFFLMDVGDNMIFGSGDRLKIEMAAEISAALSHLILVSGDRIGFGLYNEKITSLRPYFPGMKQFYSFIQSMNNTSLLGGRSDLGFAIKKSLPYLKKSSAIFIISDFLRMNEENAKILKMLMLTHEVIGIMIRDPVENKLPELDAEVVVEDIDSGEQIAINPELIRGEYDKNSAEQKKAVFELFKKSGTDILELENNKDFIVPLVEFMRKRVKKRRFVGF